MTSEQLQNEIILEMSGVLNDDQMHALQSILAQKMLNITVNEDPEIHTYDDSNMHYLELFITCKRLEGLSPSTLRQYRYAIIRFMKNGILDLSKVTTGHIRAYLGSLSLSGVKNSTINTVRAYLSAFFTWMFNEHYMVNNIVEPIGKIKVEKKEKYELTPLDIVKIRESCIDLRETALIDILESTGMRCFEISNFKLSDIDWVNKRILIHGKGSKDRWGYLTPRSQLSLQKFISERDYESDYVFCARKGNHSKVTPTSIERMVKSICDRIDMDVHIHMFRHYFCTELCRRGMPIQEVQVLLGHSSIDTTAKIYNHINSHSVANNFIKYCA